MFRARAQPEDIASRPGVAAHSGLLPTVERVGGGQVQALPRIAVPFL